ncbi:MAG: hypothetical protein ACR2PI_11515 [Hyphomicrobiaceae bacterium]
MVKGMGHVSTRLYDEAIDAHTASGNEQWLRPVQRKDTEFAATSIADIWRKFNGFAAKDTGFN